MKLFKTILALSLALSLLAGCSPIGGNSTPASTPASASTSTSTPVTEKVDIQTALYSAPDVNYEDGFFDILLSNKALTILQFGGPVPNIAGYEAKQSPIKSQYIFAISDPDSDMEKSNALRRKITIDDWVSRYGFETGYLKTGEFNGKLEDFTEKADEKSNIKFDAMNRYDWAKHYGFLADSDKVGGTIDKWEDKSIEYPFIDMEKGKANYPIVTAELSALTENYLRAKFEGAPLTTPTSKHFDKTLIEKTNTYLKAQGIDPTTVTLTIDQVQPNIYTSYPTVVVTYTISTNNSPDFTMLTQLFIFDREMVSETEFKYNLEYIADMSTNNENRWFSAKEYMDAIWRNIPREYRI